MKAYRKIKLFKFSNFESYEGCQESANDYWAELNEQNVDSEIQINSDFISVILKNIDVKKEINTKCTGGHIVSVMERSKKPEEEVVFRIKGEDMISAFNRNSNTDR